MARPMHAGQFSHSLGIRGLYLVWRGAVQEVGGVVPDRNAIGADRSSLGIFRGVTGSKHGKRKGT